MATFTQTILIAFKLCGCAAKVRQVFDVDRDTGEVTDDAPTTHVIQWGHRCQAHRGLADLEAYDRIIWEQKSLNEIEAELIANAPAEELREEALDEGGTIPVLVHEIEVEFTDKMTVRIPRQLQELEGILAPRDNVEYIWQR